MSSEALYIGLMSGTSADGIDAVLADFSGNYPQILCTYTAPWGKLQAEIHDLCLPGENEIPRLAKLDRKIGESFAAAALALLENAGRSPGHVTAIGSHGQTVRHLPPTAEKSGFTMQIGDPNIIAERTGITTVADLRRRDMAAGGHGAPLVPAFHQAIFEDPGNTHVVVNIGGLANITVLPGDGQVLGHDTGPGNTLMDAWCQKHLQQPYDREGAWAASGMVNEELLSRMLAAPYFAASPPKSTGRELFNLSWLESFFENISLPTEDIQATLLELTARTIAADVRVHNPNKVYICGGGAYNPQLMARLTALLSPAVVSSSQARGIAPQWIEATAFAWLARQTLNRLPGNAPQATGATKPVILGGIYPA